jgi:hypothetical protein
VADAPWRCSQCGTINEPVANACRTCGRWPSLFDLEEGKLDDVAVETPYEGERSFEPEPTFEPDPPFEPDVAMDDVGPEPAQPPRGEPAEGEPESSSERRRRIFGSVVVPLAVVVYLVISFVVNR